MATEPERPAPTVLAPGVTSTPDVQGGEPCVEGTRLTTDAPYAIWRAAGMDRVRDAYPCAPYGGLGLAICFEAGRRYEREQARRDKRRRWVGTINDGQAWRDKGVAEAASYLRAAGQADLAAGLEAALGKGEGDGCGR